MSFNFWTFVFEVINFLVLVYVLRRLLYAPLREAIDRRRQESARVQAEAAQARELAVDREQELHAQIAALDQQREEVIRKAREQAEAERKATLAEAERTTRQRLEAVEQQLERERAEALEALRTELVQSAVGLAERILQQAAGATLQTPLVEQLVAELERVPEAERQGLRRQLDDDEVALVETAADLNGELLDRLDRALQSLAGRTLRLSVQMRPELLGGLRVRVGGHVWDASLTGGLAELAPSASGSAPG